MAPINPELPEQGDSAPWGTELTSAVQAVIALSNSNEASLTAKADLVDGVVPTSQIPPLAISEVFIVATQAAMLALTAQRGDIAVRTDNGRTYILSTDSPGTLADWKEVMAVGVVQSVAGKTGVVALAAADITSGTFALARLPIAPSGTTSSSQIVRADDSRLSNARTPVAHTHAAVDIVSGILDTARLGSGTADATTYLRGDQTWATVAGGGGAWPPPISTSSEVWAAFHLASGTFTVASGQLALLPILVGRACTITALAMNVSTATAAVTGHVGIYASHPLYANPHGAPIASGTFDASTTGRKEITGLSGDITPGVYWVACMATGGTFVAVGAAEAENSLRNSVNRWRRDSFPDSSYLTLPTLDWGSSETRGWASSGNNPYVQMRTT